MSRSQQNADYLAQYNWMPYRNKLINGDFRIDQRYAGTSTTVSNYIADRWNFNNSTGTITKQRVANGPFGNTYSFQATVTSVGTRLSTDYFIFTQPIEGDNVMDLQWGYSTAKTCTLSFWVKNSLTGTYSGLLFSANITRSYGFTYTVNSASTWEYKTIVIPGDISGGATAYPSGNGVGMYVRFGFGGGSSNNVPAGVWSAPGGGLADVAGTASWAQTAGAVVNISMVQFEVGSVATPFEQRPFGTELALCQRYYEKSYNQVETPGTISSGGCAAYVAANSTNGEHSMVCFMVSKRTTPTITYYSTVTGTPGKVRNATTNADISSSYSNTVGESSYAGFGVATTTGNLCLWHWTASAEL